MAGEALPPTKNSNGSKPAEVLVIDGNEEHQMLSAIALGRKGFHVTAANSGKEGLRLALTRTFDAIIVDHKLRDRPAMEVLESLVERLPAVPKIFVIAPGSEDVAVRALGLGATGYLVKTARYNEVLPAEVEDQIRKAATQARLEEQQKALIQGTHERERAEDALRETEERLRLVLDQAPFILWTADPELRVTSSVGSALGRLNMNPAEIRGKSIPDLFANVDPADRFFEAHRGALAGEWTRLEREWQRRIYDIQVGPLRQKDGPVLGAFGIALDVTERVRSERIQSALYRISQAVHDTATLQELFESIHRIVGELMPVKNFYIATHEFGSDILRFPYFVDEVEAPPEPQKMARGLTEYVLRTGKPLLASPKVFEDLLASGEVEQVGPPSIDWVGVPLTTKDRTIGVLVVQSYTEGVRYTDEDRDILKFVSAQIALAIQRREAEDALRENQRALSTLISNLPGMAYRCHFEPEYQDEYVSEGCLELTGYRPAELVDGSVSWDEMIHPEDREAIWSEVQAAVSERRAYRLTYRIRTANRTTKWVWEQGRGVYGSDGEVLALEGFITDVSPAREAAPPPTESELA